MASVAPPAHDAAIVPSVVCWTCPPSGHCQVLRFITVPAHVMQTGMNPSLLLGLVVVEPDGMDLVVADLA